jgi:ArsR family transcriptional regulator
VKHISNPAEVSKDVDANAAVLAAAADPVRLRILEAVAQARCVSHLQEILPLPMNLLSYHLRILRDAGLVRSSRRGRWIDYCLAPDALDRLHAALPAVAPAAAQPCCECRPGAMRGGRDQGGAKAWQRHPHASR